jgi:5-methylcytosine-specific restriction endonuclease McrA
MRRLPRSERTKILQRRIYSTRRREWFAKHGPCRRCGGRRYLELDHIDPATKVSHKVWQWRKERREAELAKCQVLCRVCHHFKTRDQRRALIPDFYSDSKKGSWAKSLLPLQGSNQDSPDPESDATGHRGG